MSLIDIRHEDGVVRVRLTRPEKRNALNPEMVASLTSVFETPVVADGKVMVIEAESCRPINGHDPDHA